MAYEIATIGDVRSSSGARPVLLGGLTTDDLRPLMRGPVLLGAGVVVGLVLGALIFGGRKK